MGKMKAVILTKSFKNGAYCVAGVDLATSRWVRFVADEKGAAISESVCTYRDGSPCALLDIVEISTAGPAPLPYQPENVLIASGVKWEKRGSCADLSRVPGGVSYLEKDRGGLFGNRKGYLSQEEMERAKHSLTLIRVEKLRLELTEYNFKRRVHAYFDYQGEWHSGVSVTDPHYGRDSRVWGSDLPQAYSPEECLASQNYEKACLVVSLPNYPFERDGLYYKFVAAVYPNGRLP